MTASGEKQFPFEAEVTTNKSPKTPAGHRTIDIDAQYAAYDEHPCDEADEWGDLQSFREAAAAS